MEDKSGSVQNSAKDERSGRLLHGSPKKNRLGVFTFLIHFFAWSARWTFALIVFVLVMAISAWFVFSQAVKGGAHVLVPDVSGLPMTRAVNVLTEAGLELGTQKQVRTDRFPEYHVIVQRPGPNTVVREGRKVNLTISAGGQQETAPNLIGESLKSARKFIEGTRMRSGSVARIPSETPADTVLAQDPEPRRTVAVGSEIHLLVSEGPLAQPIFMPDIVGQSLEDAQLALAKLEVSIIPYKINRPGDEYEVVLAQSPEPGTLLHQGQEVSFDIRLLPSSFLPNARRKVPRLTYTVPALEKDAVVGIKVVDHTGARVILYPKPEHFVDNRPPRLLPGYNITAPEIFFTTEVTMEFYLDGFLHTSYYFEGDAEPVVTINALPARSQGGGLVQQEEIPDTPVRPEKRRRFWRGSGVQ